MRMREALQELRPGKDGKGCLSVEKQFCSSYSKGSGTPVEIIISAP